jgi:Asp-tRNA(Asn)/Glu-tRNA(Gln) amidotransferase B subunit
MHLKKLITPIIRTLNTKSANETNNEELRVKIGLEIHARILSNTKIFSDSECNDFVNDATNVNVAYFDAALPGTMPRLNRKCVEGNLEKYHNY